MKAVNLLPPESRSGRGGRLTGGAPGAGGLGALGPGAVIIAALAIIVVLILMRTLAANSVSDDHATLTALDRDIAVAQAEASRLSTFTSFISAVQGREAGVYALAVQRFPWKRTFLQLSSVMPATTRLSSLNATTTATSTLGTDGATVSGPTFTLAGCADTPDQNGVATLLRRLQLLSGVINVGFSTSSRTARPCGNQFGLTLTFAAPGGVATVGVPTTPAAPPPTPATVTTVATAGTATPVPSTTTVPATGTVAPIPTSSSPTGTSRG